MATGLAIGNFAQGLSQGLNSGMNLVLTKQKADRDAERFKLEKPKMQLEADMADRQLKAREQLKNDYANWEKTNLFDPEGNELPPEQRPSELVRRAAYFNLYTKAEMDHQAADPEKIAQRAKMGQMLQGEGIVDAMDTWFKTGDTNLTLKAFNSVGKTKAPEGTTFKTVTDAMGNQDVAIVAPGGKLLGTFNQALWMLSADNVAKNYGDSKKTIFEQEQQNKRTAVSAGAQVQSALIAQKGGMDRQIAENANRLAVAMLQQENKGVKDPIFEQLKDVVIELDSKFASNAGIQMEPELFKERSYKTASAAYLLMMEAKKEGKTLDPFTAASLARQQLGYNTPAANTPKKK